MIHITDMDRCEPSSALSRTAEPNHWRLVEYVSDEVSGTMLAAGPLANAPEVTCPLDLEGWHAVHVGYWHPSIGDAESERVAIKVKLTGDPFFTSIADNEQDELIRSTLRETFWKCADLTGEQFTVGQYRHGLARGGYLAYLRLEPLSETRLEEVLADRADDAGHRADQ